MKTIYTFKVLASKFVNGSGYAYTNNCIECTAVDESFQIDFDYSFSELAYQLFVQSDNGAALVESYVADTATYDVEYTVQLVKITEAEDGDEDEDVISEESRWESDMAKRYAETHADSIYDIDKLSVLLDNRYLTRREAERYLASGDATIYTPEDFIESLKECDGCLEDVLEEVEMTESEFLAALNEGKFGTSTLDCVTNGVYKPDYDSFGHPYVVVFSL